MKRWSKALAVAAASGSVFGCNALLGNAERDLSLDGSSDGPTVGDDGGSGGSGAASGSSGGAASSTGTTSGTSGASGTSGTGGTSSGSTDGGASSGPSGNQDAGTPPTPTSCALGLGGAGTTGCGANLESCCASLQVPAGQYDRTYTPEDGGGASGEADPATVSSFWLDKYEVTIGRFRHFVKAWNGGAGYLPHAGSGKHSHLNGGFGLADTMGGFEPGWDSSFNTNVSPTDANLACGTNALWTTAPGAHEGWPINCVGWYEAYAFCIWDGGFLPSEAEWEYAAAGGSQQREYPWGSMDPGLKQMFADYDCEALANHCSNGPNTIAAVGTAPMGAGLWGHMDLAGNLEEWTLDTEDTYANPCIDCGNIQPTNNRAVRGGSYASTATGDITPPSRVRSQVAARDPSLGFRCARTP